MIKVYVSKAGQYPIKATKVKKFLKSFFEKEGIVSDAYVSVAFVGENKMLKLAKKYYGDNKLHNVFSFVENEAGEFVNPKGSGINLGEIVICYPVAVNESVSEGVLIEERILELISHAGEHLMGRHHE